MFQNNSNREKQVIILMIWDGDIREARLKERDWHYLAVKKLSALRGLTTKHHGDFYYFSYLHSFTTEKKFKSHKKVSENKDFCNVIIAFEDSKILELNLIKHHLLFTQILNA